MFAPQSQLEARGAALVLEHCAALDRLTHSRRTVSERLQAVLGPDLARVLVHGLAAGPSREAA